MRKPNYKRISQFGYISVLTQGPTAATANQKGWLFMIQDGNKNEVYRNYGADIRPTVYGNDIGYTWRSLNRIQLTDNFEFPLYLRVVNALEEAIDITIIKK